MQAVVMVAVFSFVCQEDSAPQLLEKSAGQYGSPVLYFTVTPQQSKLSA